jgi:hypothetical protein
MGGVGPLAGGWDHERYLLSGGGPGRGNVLAILLPVFSKNNINIIC